MILITQQKQVDTSFLNPTNAKLKRHLYRKAEQQVLELADTLERLERVHKAQLGEARSALQTGELSDASYHLLPKDAASTFGDFLKLKLGKFIMPYGIRMNRQVHHIDENDPLL